jgi:pimeloyl-ACP methyl ester carboxylesterase
VRRGLAVLGGGALVLSLACASPTGIRRVDARDVHRTLTANVLSTGEPSVPTRQTLQRLGLRDLFASDPVAAIDALHAKLLEQPNSAGRLFALAELSFWLGERDGDRLRYLTAAVYAYAFLFPAAGVAPPEPTDPRYRIACDLYNRGLTEGMSSVKLRSDTWAGEVMPLRIGDLDVRFDPRELEWAGWRLGDFLPAAYFEVRGLRNRYRFPGIGAPLVASLEEPLDGADAARRRAHIPPRLKVPVSGFLRIDDARAQLAAGGLEARLELFTQDEALAVEVEGTSVPLEFETSSALAYTLDGPPVWWEELRGFLYGGVLPRLTAAPQDQILFLHPYRPGRIPVVLVHGTASSVVRWAELVNELESDRAISERYQLWLYRYDSGNPIGFSGGVFRQALAETLAELDPEGRDPALAQMVVIGHSQGGLLTKLTAVDSEDRFWKGLSRKSLDELDLEDEEREVLRRSAFFTPLPFVKRVVFVATPHRGSYLTLQRLGRWVASLVEVPHGLSQLTFDLVTRNRDDLLIRSLDRPATAIDNMTPRNPFLQTLLKLPIADGIRAHSIIAVDGDGPAEEGADGVVQYRSAFLEQVESTLVVRSGHSCQGNFATIEEIRRILREHAGVE